MGWKRRNDERLGAAIPWMRKLPYFAHNAFSGLGRWFVSKRVNLTAFENGIDVFWANFDVLLLKTDALPLRDRLHRFRTYKPSTRLS